MDLAQITARPAARLAQTGTMGAAAIAGPAVTLTNPRTSDDSVGWIAPIAAVTGLGLLGVTDIIAGRFLRGGAMTALGTGIGAGVGILATPAIARAIGDPPDTTTDADAQKLARAMQIARSTPTGRRVVDRLQQDGVDVRFVDSLPSATGRGESAGMYDYVSNRLMLSHAENPTAEGLADTIVHEGQHHIDDLSVADGIRELATGSLTDHMYDNEVRAFTTGSTMLLERLQQVDPTALAQARAGRVNVEASPEGQRLLDALSNERCFDYDTLSVLPPDQARQQLEQDNYVHIP